MNHKPWLLVDLPALMNDERDEENEGGITIYK
jgi:hypothetical protein